MYSRQKADQSMLFIVSRLVNEYKHLQSTVSNVVGHTIVAIRTKSKVLIKDSSSSSPFSAAIACFVYILVPPPVYFTLSILTLILISGFLLDNFTGVSPKRKSKIHIKNGEHCKKRKRKLASNMKP
jgi:hypothetical protein